MRENDMLIENMLSVLHDHCLSFKYLMMSIVLTNLWERRAAKTSQELGVTVCSCSSFTNSATSCHVLTQAIFIIIMQRKLKINNFKVF